MENKTHLKIFQTFEKFNHREIAFPLWRDRLCLEMTHINYHINNITISTIQPSKQLHKFGLDFGHNHRNLSHNQPQICYQFRNQHNQFLYFLLGPLA